MEEEEKLSNRLTAAILKDLRLEIEQCSKYQLIFVTGGGFVEAFSFLAEKN